MSREELELAKLEAINNLHINCREIAKNFYDCLENIAQNANILYINEHKDFDYYMINDGIPVCLAKYNIEYCKLKYNEDLY